MIQPHSVNFSLEMLYKLSPYGLVDHLSQFKISFNLSDYRNFNYSGKILINIKKLTNSSISILLS